MAISFVAKGSWGAGTTSFSPGIPAGMQAGDLMILDVHTCNQAVTTPSGWTTVTGTPISTGTANTAGGTRLTQYYRWWQSGDSAPSVAVSGGTVSNGIISGYRGVDTTTPFDATPTSNIISTASTTLTFASITTATAGAMLHLAAARDQDLNSTAAVSSWTNANLTGLTEIHDQVVNTGVGGGIANAYGTKATAGSTGSTTATQTSSIACCMTIALRPLPPVTHATSGALAGEDAAVVGAAARAAGGGATLEIKQAGYNIDDSGTSQTTISATLTGVTAGSALVACIGYSNIGGGVSVSCSDGTAYSESASGICTDTGNNQHSRVFYLANAGSGSHTITITFGSAQAFLRLVVLEVGGVATTSPEDGSADQAQSSPGLGNDVISSSATGTTTQADAIVLGFTQNTGETHPSGDITTAGTGYTLITGTPNILRAEYKIVSATGTQTATFGQNTVSRSRTTHALVLKKAAGGATTHATTGALEGSGAATAGSAAHVALHATTGALAGSGTATAGSASRFRAHDAAGTVTGPGAALAGSANRTRQHATTGTLAAPGSATAGSASRFRTFSTSGVLAGQGATVTGAANRFRAHAATGTLAGQGSAVAGAAARTRQHATTGTLTEPGTFAIGAAQHNVPHGSSGTIAASEAAVVGAANRNTTAVTHATTGALAGPGTAVTGSALRFRSFATSGALAGVGSAAGGSAARFRAFATTGALTGPGSLLAGVGSRWRAFGSTGALAGSGTAVTGSAARTRQHAAVGVLTGPNASVLGAAQHNVPHASTGSLTGTGTAVTGAASRNATIVTHTTAGSLGGQDAAVASNTTRFRAFSAAGGLKGTGTDLAGIASRWRAFDSSGTLAGQGAAANGASQHRVLHTAAGVLAGASSVLVGSAARFRTFGAAGALSASQGASVGASQHIAIHAASGVLVAAQSLLTGASSRAGTATSISATSLDRLREIWARMELDPANPVAITSTQLVVGTINQQISETGASRSGSTLSNAVSADTAITEIWQRLGLDPANPLVQDETTIQAGAIQLAVAEAAGVVTVTRQ